MVDVKRSKIDEGLLDDFRRDLENVVEEFIDNDRVEIFGNLRIEVANMDALALIKGNTIYVNIAARNLPKYVIKYIVAHELAHLAIKKHTKKFWEFVKHIYPQYEKGRDRLIELYRDRELRS